MEDANISKTKKCKSGQFGHQDNVDRVFFYINGFVHREFVPHETTVNQRYYVALRRCLQESIRQKHLEKWCTQNWVLHHDNASAHKLRCQPGSSKPKTMWLPLPIHRTRQILRPATYFVPEIKTSTEGEKICRTVEENNNTGSSENDNKRRL